MVDALQKIANKYTPLIAQRLGVHPSKLFEGFPVARAPFETRPSIIWSEPDMVAMRVQANPGAVVLLEQDRQAAAAAWPPIPADIARVPGMRERWGPTTKKTVAIAVVPQ